MINIRKRGRDCIIAWVKTQDRIKGEAKQNFTNTDHAIN